VNQQKRLRILTTLGPKLFQQKRIGIFRIPLYVNEPLTRVDDEVTEGPIPIATQGQEGIIDKGAKDLLKLGPASGGTNGGK
jgi:hypothetical protein